MALTTYVEAIRQGIWEEMERDDNVFVLGEDVGIYGGAFKVTDGMLERFGELRVVDTPISESGIVGAAIGAALMLSLIHISEPTRLLSISYAVFCLKKKI